MSRTEHKHTPGEEHAMRVGRPAEGGEWPGGIGERHVWGGWINQGKGEQGSRPFTHGWPPPPAPHPRQGSQSRDGPHLPV